MHLQRGMSVLELEPFIPSGADHALSKKFFAELGFQVNWQTDELCELQLGGVKLLLQNYHNKEMQDNLMMHVLVDDLDEFWTNLGESGVVDRYEAVSAREPTVFPCGREVHLIDPAGVCWHFAGNR
jgi:hypothetical protein